MIDISGQKNITVGPRPASRAQPQRSLGLGLQHLSIRVRKKVCSPGALVNTKAAIKAYSCVNSLNCASQQSSALQSLQMVCATDDNAAQTGVSRVVIAGGGIIGTAISYYLAKRGVTSTVVDRCGLAAAASGRAGGFLALDWNDASGLGPLARLSYKMHAGLEEELGIDIDYRHAHPALHTVHVLLLDGDIL